MRKHKKNIFCKRSFGKNSVFFQPKLTLENDSNMLEQEADSAAEQVIRMSVNNNENSFFKPDLKNSIQRKCNGCEEEETVQKKENQKPENEGGADVENYIGNINSAGSLLPGNVRNFFEPRFGYDFSDVKIHTDSSAAESAESLNALAYTSGINIVFNENQYSPETDSGKRLLAHELTHVVQQKKGISTKKIQKAPITDIGKKKSGAGEFDPLTGIYTVAKGDNLTTIANRFGVTIARLQANNKEIVDPNKISVGQKIFIPELIMPKDPTGDVSNTLTVDEYVKKWEAEKGRKITPAEKRELARGCVGITSILIDADPLDTLDRCFDTFEKSLIVARADNERFKKAGLDKKKKSVIFSMRFWSGGRSYAPDKTGRVDMTDYDSRLTSGDAYKPKPGGGTYTNFDFGYYDITTGMWWHANHKEPGMEIYESTLEHYSRRLADFDRQIFCVATANLT